MVILKTFSGNSLISVSFLEIKLVPLIGLWFPVSLNALWWFVDISTFEKNSHLSHYLQIGLCTGKDLCPSAWLELLGACKPFMMICLAGFGCVTSHLVMFVGFFFRFLQSCSLWCFVLFYFFMLLQVLVVPQNHWALFVFCILQGYKLC